MISPTPRMIAEKDGPVGRLIFNKPERHNATSSDMWAAIPVILDDFEKDPAIRVVVVTGAGDKAFVSGADISEFETARSTPEQVKRYDEIGELANTRLTKCSKPTIARIRGYCVGGGLAVSLTCDIRIASENSKFAVPAAKLGLGYRAAGIKTLMNVVGPAYAKEIFYTGRLFDAAEAPIEELTRLDGKADLGRSAALVKECFESEDYIEGRRAFMEKRKPAFKGR